MVGKTTMGKVWVRASLLLCAGEGGGLVGAGRWEMGGREGREEQVASPFPPCDVCQSVARAWAMGRFQPLFKDTAPLLPTLPPVSPLLTFFHPFFAPPSRSPPPPLPAYNVCRSAARA